MDLPTELQTEIFSFLSLKHIRNILLINKSTYNRITTDPFYWKQILQLYRKHIDPSYCHVKIEQLDFGENFYQDSIRPLIGNLIDEKINYLDNLFCREMKYYAQVEKQSSIIRELTDSIEWTVECLQKSTNTDIRVSYQHKLTHLFGEKELHEDSLRSFDMKLEETKRIIELLRED